MKWSEIVILALLSFMVLYLIYGHKTEVTGKELVHEQEVQIVDSFMGDKYANPSFEPNDVTFYKDLSELEIQCDCGVTTKIIGKELGYKQIRSITTDLPDPKIEIAIPTMIESQVEHVSIEILVDLPDPIEPEYIKGYKIYTEEDLDRIYKDEPALGQLVKWLYGYETKLTYYNINHLIPTWPKYIELQENLYIDLPAFRGTDDPRKPKKRIIPIGTRIFFKKNNSN